MGDFNDFLWPEDKNGRVDDPNWLFQGFCNTVSDCNLVDLPRLGYQYTRFCSKGTVNAVEERLDRAMRENVSWLKEGDFNTHFFPQAYSARRKANKTLKLKEANDSYGVIEAFPPIISNVDNAFLIGPFTHEEFVEAIAFMKPDKSPGPDGFNPGFYQKFWSVVCSDVYQSCVNWPDVLAFPPALCQTNLVLVPKCTVNDEGPKTNLFM
ncbi:hypothetical protein ACS0TY_030184 [Phlomoides rotata]